MKGLSPLTLNVQLPPTVLIILLYLIYDVPRFKEAKLKQRKVDA